MLLARKGYRVLLLDQARLPSDMVMSTHFIHQRGIACLARWGLRNQIAATRSLPVADSKLDLGPLTLYGSAPAVDGEVFAFAPRRHLLDAILIRAAEAGGAEIRERQRVDGLLAEADRVTGVRGVSEQGTAFSEKARLVIGADGPSSRVAKAVQARRFNMKPALQATAWIYWDGLFVDRFELYQRDYEAIYAFPSSHGCTLIGANWSRERFRSVRGNVEAAYFELLRRAAPGLADEAAGARRADERLYLGSTRNFWRTAQGPGWALLGDARCKKDPCTAQGITDAFCDAEALAQAVDESFSGAKELSTALAEYERERTAWSMPFYELTCRLATFAPPSADMLALYAGLQNSQKDLTQFIGLISEATLPGEFFAPENIRRITGRSADASAGSGV